MQNHQFWTYFLFGFLALIFQTTSQANDTTSSTPGRDLRLEKTDSIRMKSEILKISPKKVSIEYIFRNEATKDFETTVAFPLAPYWNIYTGSGGGQSQFEDFMVSVDGKKVSYQTRSKVEHDQKDITEGLEKLGMPTDRFLPLSAIKPSTLEALKKNKWYNSDDDYPDGELNAVYTVQKTHYWNQNFPAQKDIKSLHSYSPQLGDNSAGAISFFTKWSRFFTKEIQNQGHYVNESLKAEHYEYILSTGSNWKNGIETIDLQIDGAAVIFVDIDGETDFDLSSYRLKKKNFKPKGELLIEFLGIGKSAKLPADLTLQKEVDGPANCRRSPNGPTVFSIPDHMKVSLKERESDWYRVKFNDRECWTHRKNLRFLAEAR